MEGRHQLSLWSIVNCNELPRDVSPWNPIKERDPDEFHVCAKLKPNDLICSYPSEAYCVGRDIKDMIGASRRERHGLDYVSRITLLFISHILLINSSTLPHLGLIKKFG